MDDGILSYFNKQLAFCAEHQRFTDCPYYPCHEAVAGQAGQNCLFCYCPLYPCGETDRGGQWIVSAKGTRVWSCENCTFIHDDRNVAKILKWIYEGIHHDELLRLAQGLE